MENKSYCYNCKNDTSNIQLFHADEFLTQDILRRNDSGDETQKLYALKYHEIYVYKCLGCEHIHVENRYRIMGEEKVEIICSPSKNEFEIRSFIEELPLKYFKKLIEINNALNHEMYWLATFGIRTIVDEYITDTIGDIGGFEQKINKMKSSGYITNKQEELLKTVIDAGSASAHRGYEPDKETIQQIIQIVYNIFENIILDRRAGKIKEKTPKRQKKRI